MYADRPLPVAPPPLPGEAFSSWVARLAARYDLAAEDLAAALGAPGPIGPRQDHTVPLHLAEALGRATGVGVAAVSALALSASLPALPVGWMRDGPVWCQACVADAAAGRDEVHRQALWAAGFLVICPVHGLPLRTAADFDEAWTSSPCCLQPQLDFAGADGRLHLACQACGARHERRKPGSWLAARAGPAVAFQDVLLRAAAGNIATEGWALGLAPEVALTVAAEVCELWVFRRRAAGGEGSDEAWTPARVPPHALIDLFETVAWLLDSAPDQDFGTTPAARELRPRFRGLHLLRLRVPSSRQQAERLASRWPEPFREAFCRVSRD